jgi:hypothetical protein
MRNNYACQRFIVFTLICFWSSLGLVHGHSYKALVGTHFSNLEKSLKDSLVHCSYAYQNKEEVDVFVLDKGAIKDNYRIIEFQMRLYVLNDIISRVSIVDFTFKKALNESSLYHEIKDMHNYYNDTSFYDGESVAFIKEGLFVKTRLMPSEFSQNTYDWVTLSYGTKDSFEYKNKDGSNVLDYGFIDVEECQLVDKSPLNFVILKVESYNSEVNRIKIRIRNNSEGFLSFFLDKNFYDSDNNYHILDKRDFIKKVNSGLVR